VAYPAGSSVETIVDMGDGLDADEVG